MTWESTDSDSDCDVFCSFYLAKDEAGNVVPIQQYRRGEKIEEWLIKTKQKIFQKKCQEPAKTLTMSLQPSALRYAIDEGFDTNASFDEIINKLRETFRYDGRLPTLTQLFILNGNSCNSDRATVVEIYSRAREIIEKRKGKELIDETALSILLCTLPKDLAEEIKKTNPRTVQQAIKGYFKAKKRLRERRRISDKENIPMDID